MKTADLEAEHRAAVRNLTTEDAKELVDQLLIPFFLVIIHQMVGIMPIRLDKTGWWWEPDPEGDLAYITPLRIDRPDTVLSPEAWGMPRMGELVDLIAWDPRHPRRWALRTGASTWLGCIPWGEPFPALIRSNPLAWLQADCDGLVLLTRKPSELRAIFGDLDHGIECVSHRLSRQLNNLIRQPLDNATIIARASAGSLARSHIMRTPAGARDHPRATISDHKNYTPLREEDA